MVSYDVLTRTFRIKYHDSCATAFTIEENNIQYLVTAKHLFESAVFPITASIELLINGLYQTFTVFIKYPADTRVDIAVMKTHPYYEVSDKMQNTLTSADLIYGQDIYFLGYPYSYDNFVTTFPNSFAPVPFVKKAVFSGMLKPSPSLLFLDGHNNPGFSGGPVCYKKAGSTFFSIAGVISGYEFEKKFVFNEETNTQIPLYVKENAGIIRASDISFALDLAKSWDT